MPQEMEHLSDACWLVVIIAVVEGSSVHGKNPSMVSKL